MPQHHDLSRSLLTLDQTSTLIAVIEMSQASWLVAAIVLGIDRHPLKKIAADEADLLALLRRWQAEAAKAGQAILRIAVAFEAGRNGFWPARWRRPHAKAGKGIWSWQLRLPSHSSIHVKLSGRSALRAVLLP